MGEADRYREYFYPKRNRFTLGQDGNNVMTLFVINVVFFLLLLFIQAGFSVSGSSIEEYENTFLPWVSLPAGIQNVALKPWTLFIYFFTDSGGMVMQFVSNMIWLWVFGSVLQEMAGNDKLFPAYIYGGIVGGIFFIFGHYIFPGNKPYINQNYLLGANTAVIAIAMAATTFAPGYRFFRQIAGGIPLWVLMALYLLIDLAGVSFGLANSFAHFGGAIAGFLYAFLIKKGTDTGSWMHNLYTWLTDKFTLKMDKKAIKEKVFYDTGKREPFSKNKLVSQARIDEILDKINQKGYESLSEDEKQILKRAADD